jgi:hypothetical protein
MAVLVLAFLGFGVLIGRAARNSVQQAALADAAAPVKVVVAPRLASPPITAQAPVAEEAPTAEAAPTPEPSPSPSPAATSAPAAATPTATTPAAKPKSAPAKEPKTLPAIKHVFVVVLSDQPYAAVFGPESKAKYLVAQLEPKGTILSRYDAIAHEELPNEVALVSGQGPTLQTAADCPSYAPVEPANLGADGQVLGEGCVYPASVATLPGELEKHHLRWQAYLEGVAEGSTTVAACAHPSPGETDPTTPPAGASVAAGATGPYATYRNPFAYFQSLTGSGACARSETGIGQLKKDLAKPSKTPSLAYIVPGLCHDAAPTPCSSGAPSGPADADSFLQRVVPEILASAAYKQNGLLVITTDEAPSSGEFEDSSSCCGQPAFPNLGALGTTPAGRPRGGGAVGALLLSPFIKTPGSSQEAYNHYSLLATIEQLFGLEKLGYAALSGVTPLAPSIFAAGE